LRPLLANRHGDKAADIIIKQPNRVLEASSGAILILESWLKQKIVNNWHLYGLNDYPAQQADIMEVNRDPASRHR
jgi:hypothetical protein